MSELGKLDVPQLWALAQLEGDPATDKQVQAWKSTARSVDIHLTALRAAASDLALAWSPDKSEAARSFLDFVNELVLSMEKTRRAASNTSEALNAINQVIKEAKADIGKLNTEWQQKAATEHENNTDSVKDTVVKFFTGEDDLPDNWREQLNQKAAKVLNKLDSQVAQAYVALEKPADYVASGFFAPESTHDVDTEAAGGGGAALGAGAGAAYSAAAASVIPPLAPPATISGNGPALSGGVVAPPVTAPIGGGPLPLSPGGSPISGLPTPAGAGPMTLPGRVIGAGPGGGAPLGKGPGAQPRTVPGGRPAALTPKARPSGEVIGGKSVPGRSGTAGTPGASPTRRAMPSRGVIGGSSDTTRTGAGQPGRQRDRRDAEERKRFDPNDPWRVEQGVPGVIVPSEEPEHHDPGPGVIGVDR